MEGAVCQRLKRRGLISRRNTRFSTDAAARRQTRANFAILSQRKANGNQNFKEIIKFLLNYGGLMNKTPHPACGEFTPHQSGKA
jgi:hypothetical protein